ncbi:hypothetical protein [Falsirhodobacter halotolerans]|uniref:hypothetical protein n=1 Tax=Falsirhodobacter halotolerans TaxID=1146892 RepID=UPI001FD1A9A1|nr:hypothetical protein [Falsirhodobacter halotolerans]MCJ8138574.1 hypothetical protein [Falsirhodobacter halotolerans]
MHHASISTATALPLATYDRFLVETSGTSTYKGTVYTHDWAPLDGPVPLTLHDAMRAIAGAAGNDDTMSAIRCTRINTVSGRCEDATTELRDAFDECDTPGICITNGPDGFGVRRFGTVY